MKVFMSWSGGKSRAVAVALRDWLPSVLQNVEPFVSAEDIHAGTRWESEIASQLDASNFGIVCVTRENQGAPWLNFEAGALAKTLDVSRVVPLAIDMKTSDVELPLGQFQAQPADEDGIGRVVSSLNAALGDEGLPEERLRNAFDKWWPDLKAQLEAIEEQTSVDAPPVRTERELLEETLNTVRAVARAIDRPDFGLTPEERFSGDLRRAAVRRGLDALPERERRVLQMRFGFEGEPMTLKAIGNVLGLSRERVRQLEAQALARLAALRDVSDTGEQGEVPTAEQDDEAT